MKAVERPIGEDDLHAFVDGQLPPERMAAVEAFLAERPDCARTVARDREARALLRDRLQFKADEPIPARLRVASIRARRGETRRRQMAWAAAACLLLAGGGAGGWTARDRLGAGPSAASPWATVAREALSAHRTFAIEIAHPVEVKADQEDHLAKWLSKRLGHRLVVPDLDGIGFHLIGGRLLPAGRQVAAQLMYGDDSGQRLTVYVRSGEHGESALRFTKDGELSSFSWIDGGLGYAVSGPMDRDHLMAVAREISRDVGGETGPRGADL